MVKDPPCNAGDMGLIPELERSPGEANGKPLSSLGNPMECHEVMGPDAVIFIF